MDMLIHSCNAYTYECKPHPRDDHINFSRPQVDMRDMGKIKNFMQSSDVHSINSLISLPYFLK